MARPSGADLAKIQDIAHVLRTWSEDRPNAIRECVPTIAELFEADKVLFHSLEWSNGGFDVPDCETYGIDSVALKAALQGVVRGTEGRWAVYDPSRPAAWDRNRVIPWSKLQPHYPKDDDPPVVKALFTPFKLNLEGQTRALICDGPSMLGWFGGFWPKAPSARAISALAMMVPLFQRRLLFERTMRTAPLMRAALAATLEAIPAAAFLTSANGSPLHVNEAGRAALDSEGTAMRETLLRLANGGVDAPGYTVTRVSSVGSAVWLLIVRRKASQLQARAERVASLWRLSARQRDVLRLLVMGYPNARIGAELGISDRTAEVHVAAILEKAQVGTRAALVALVASNGDGSST